MKYPYIVKYKGKWYESGEDVPEIIKKEENVPEEFVEKTVRRGRPPKTEE